MAVAELVVRNYRSLRDVRLELPQLAVIVGPNGCGKTNVYRSLALLQAAATGRLARSIADEGGMASVLWAGDRKRGVVRMVIEVAIPPLRFAMELGLPQMGRFRLDPEVKEEELSIDDGGRRVALVERRGPSAQLRDADGHRVSYPLALRIPESILGQLRDVHRFPTLGFARDEIAAWRLYHHFRTDPGAPSRRPRVAIETPVLDDEGNDLAAALATIEDIGDKGALAAAVRAAFPGAQLHVAGDNGLEVQLATPGLHRPMAAAELSDGTLRYLCLLAALLSPRLPPLLVLNEPETSLHPDLHAPLADLIADAARKTQVVVTTHALDLAERACRRARVEPIRLAKVDGATRSEGQRGDDRDVERE